MATQTRLLQELDGGGGIWLRYDDVSLLATGVIVHNTTGVPILAQVVRDSDGKVYGQTFQPGDTTINIPTNQANRLSLTVNSRGGLDGYEFACTIPAP